VYNNLRTALPHAETADALRDECRELMATALRNFATAQTPPALSFQAYDRRPYERNATHHGLTWLRLYFEAFGARESDECLSDRNDWVSGLGLTSIATSEYPIVDLALCTEVEGRIGMFGFRVLERLEGPLARSMTSLRKLSISLTPETLDPRETKTPLGALTNCIPGLTELSIVFEDYDLRSRRTHSDEAKFKLLAKWLKKTKLESLKIRGGQITDKGLRDVLASVKNSLKRLTLRHFSLQDPLQWRGGLVWIADNFQLCYLEANDLSKACTPWNTSWVPRSCLIQPFIFSRVLRNMSGRK